MNNNFRDRFLDLVVNGDRNFARQAAHHVLMSPLYKSAHRRMALRKICEINGEGRHVSVDDRDVLEYQQNAATAYLEQELDIGEDEGD